VREKKGSCIEEIVLLSSKILSTSWRPNWVDGNSKLKLEEVHHLTWFYWCWEFELKYNSKLNRKEKVKQNSRYKFILG